MSITPLPSAAQSTPQPLFTPLKIGDLLAPDEFIRHRPSLLKDYQQLSRLRRLLLGPDCLILFEHRQMVTWQIQEMVRIEKGSHGQLEQELEVYGPLEPSPQRLVITAMLQFPQKDLRRQRLEQLVGFERHIQLEIRVPSEGCFSSADSSHGADRSQNPGAPVTEKTLQIFQAQPVPSQDVYHTTRDKTLSVHFLEIPLPAPIESLGARQTSYAQEHFGISGPLNPSGHPANTALEVTLRCTHPSYLASALVPAHAWKVAPLGQLLTA